MLASFDRLGDDLRQLKAYGRFLERASALSRLTVRRRLRMAEHLAGLQSTREALSQTALSTLHYSSLVVALYGAVERFAEASVSEYVKYLNAVCPRYSLLPAALRDAHVAATLKLLQAPDLDRRGSTAELIGDLHSCLEDDESYKLTAATFAYHTANLRHSMLHELWSAVGVPEVSTAIHSDKSYRAAVESVDPGESERSFFRFDDIALRRNEVAHGAPVVELLSFDLLLQYVEIVEALAGALRKHVTSTALGVLVSHHGVHRGLPLAVYNNDVVCLRCESGQICLGDLLVARRPDGSFSGGRIVDVQVGGASRGFVDAGEGFVDVGLKTEIHAKPNQEFWNVSHEGATGAVWRSAFLPQALDSVDGLAAQ